MRKKSLLIYLFTLLVLSTAFGQSNIEKIQNEIDEKVWKPFIAAYNQLDADGFNGLHTDDVIRATTRGLLIGEEYRSMNRKVFEREKASGKPRTIEIRLESRLTNDQVSYEVGYYKVSRLDQKEEPAFYGRFHVVVKKINGEWKIAQDWDNDDINGVKVTEKDFFKNNPMQFE